MDTSRAGSDGIRLYRGDRDVLTKPLERIRATAAEILGAVMDREAESKEADGEPCVPVAAQAR